jgi:NADH dehydrogenase
MVSCLARDIETARTFLAKDVELIRGDLAKTTALAQGCEGAEAVVHLAGIFFERGGDTFKKVLAAGTRNLVECAKKAGVRRFLYVSSLGADLKSRDRYLKAKAEAEQIVRESGLEYTLFRPTLIYGPDDELIYRYGRLAYHLPAVPIIASGQNPVRPILVNDAVSALLAALEQPVSVGKEYVLGGAQVILRRDITDTVIHVFRQKKFKIPIPLFLYYLAAHLMETFWPHPWITRQHLNMLIRPHAGDISALRKELGVEPISFEEGVRHYIGL